MAESGTAQRVVLWEPSPHRPDGLSGLLVLYKSSNQLCVSGWASRPCADSVCSHCPGTLRDRLCHPAPWGFAVSGSSVYQFHPEALWVSPARSQLAGRRDACSFGFVKA